MPWAVSGLRYTRAAASSTGPMKVLNMRLNMRGAVSVPLLPHTGHCAVGSPGVPLMRGSSARNRFLQCLQSTSGSVNRHVTRGFPYLGVHQDRRVQAFDVLAIVDHRAPPALLDVFLQLDAQRSVVPHRAEEIGRA